VDAGIVPQNHPHFRDVFSKRWGWDDKRKDRETTTWALLKLSKNLWDLLLHFIVTKCKGKEAKKPKKQAGGKASRRRKRSFVDVFSDERQADISASKAKEWSITPNSFQFLSGLTESEKESLIHALYHESLDLAAARSR